MEPSLTRAAMTLGPSGPGVLSQGPTRGLQEVCKFPEMHAKFSLCACFSGEGLHQSL